jgi:hypothetical protein
MVMNSGHLLGKPTARPSGREQDMRNFPDCRISFLTTNRCPEGIEENELASANETNGNLQKNKLQSALKG